MTEDPSGGKAVVFNHRLTVRQGVEPAVVISKRQYLRLIERLDGCKQRGWAELWLAGAGAGATLAVGALVGIKTLPQAPEPGARNVLWVMVALGVLAAGICALAYLNQRHNQGKEIDELKRDLQMHVE
jgi:hypothetical protein